MPIDTPKRYLQSLTGYMGAQILFMRVFWIMMCMLWTNTLCSMASAGKRTRTQSTQRVVATSTVTTTHVAPGPPGAQATSDTETLLMRFPAYQKALQRNQLLEEQYIQMEIYKNRIIGQFGYSEHTIDLINTIDQIEKAIVHETTQLMLLMGKVENAVRGFTKADLEPDEATLSLINNLLKP